jgi:hypothetical protein
VTGPIVPDRFSDKSNPGGYLSARLNFARPHGGLLRVGRAKEVAHKGHQTALHGRGHELPHHDESFDTEPGGNDGATGGWILAGGKIIP